jgi:hypothetical protein
MPSASHSLIRQMNCERQYRVTRLIKSGKSEMFAGFLRVESKNAAARALCDPALPYV